MLHNNGNLLYYYCVNFNYLNSNNEFNSCSFVFQFFRKKYEMSMNVIGSQLKIIEYQNKIVTDEINANDDMRITYDQ